MLTTSGLKLPNRFPKNLRKTPLPRIDLQQILHLLHLPGNGGIGLDPGKGWRPRRSMEGPGCVGTGEATSEARHERRTHRCVIGFRRQAACGTLLRTFSEIPVTTVSATEARRRLYALIDEVGQSHQPVQIQGKRGNAVLISEADWRSIEETLHLLAIPGMRESILEGMATEASELSTEPGW